MSEPEHEQQPVCVLCLPRYDPDTRTWWPRHCDLCVGRDVGRWCECLCDWVIREGKP